ncbi:MAG: ATP-binding cassette domain-containing protein [Pyrodictiaceae archaeon]
MMMRIEDLEVRVPGFRLEVEELEVERGEYLILLGPSGVGKTLLVAAIAGLVRPSKGRIIINGRDVTNLPPEKRNVVIVPQNYALFPHMTVYDNIAYGLRARKLPEGDVEKRVHWIAELLEISHLLYKKPRQLSGGEQQRVALARALVVKPSLILLDEPLNALDPRLRSRAIQLLRRLHEELGFTAIHVTHNLAEAMALATRIAYMEEGKLLGVYKPVEFLETHLARPYIGEYEALLGLIQQARRERSY